ncbi:MAG: peptide deformylase, partial [Streptosporangiaceae bacterium]
RCGGRTVDGGPGRDRRLTVHRRVAGRRRRAALRVSTGFGALATRFIPPDQRRQLQVSLVRSHAAGSGPEVEREDLVNDMVASMRAADGVGLAANQIGTGLRVFVYDCPHATGEHQAGHVVNPVLRIPAALAPPATDAEGCLSVPGQYALVSRPALATVTGLDARSQPVTVTGTGFLARCLQHEVDHLDGIVYVDRLPDDERAAILAAAQADDE